MLLVKIVFLNIRDYSIREEVAQTAMALDKRAQCCGRYVECGQFVREDMTRPRFTENFRIGRVTALILCTQRAWQ
jgi:hypothetical protein